MIAKEQIMDWLKTHADGTGIWIGEGGLTLESEEGGYIEVGGEPLPEDKAPQEDDA